MNSNLLRVAMCRAEPKTDKVATPVVMEFSVDPQTAPYLVSSSRGLMWIESPHSIGSSHIIKAAVVKDRSPGDMFWASSVEIFKKSTEMEWGSAHPFTPSGLSAAIDHVSEYTSGPFEVIVNNVYKDTEDKSLRWLTDREMGEDVVYADWVPAGCAIVVPTDRAFVGVIFHVSKVHSAIAVHNPGRGFAICWNGGK